MEFRTKAEVQQRISRLQEWIATWDRAADDPFIAKSYRRVADAVVELHGAEIERLRAMMPGLEKAQFHCDASPRCERQCTLCSFAVP